MIDVAADGRSATVVDGILTYYDQAPATAKTVVKNRNLLRVEWIMKPGKGKAIPSNFSLQFKINTGKAYVTVDLPEDNFRSHASGTCRKV